MTTKPPRVVKTPAVRALERVAVLERRLAKVKRAKAALEKQARDLVPEIDAIQGRLDYARASPDMPAAKKDSPPGQPTT